MKVSIDPGALKQSHWHEYAVRFVFGGLITVLAGVIARRYGPAMGGLFLAFPAIFPASATLVEKHEAEKKQERGLKGDARGKDAAAVDAMGAALGSIGLMAFGAVVWQLATVMPGWAVFPVALCAWCVVSGLCWVARKRLGGRPLRRHAGHSPAGRTV